MQVKVMILGVGFFPLPRNIRLACVKKDPALRGERPPPPPPHTPNPSHGQGKSR